MNAPQTNLFTVHLNLTGKAGSGHVEPVRVSNAKKFVKECYYRKVWSRNAFTRQDKRVNDAGTMVTRRKYVPASRNAIIG